jgi:mono/diheme cytochrome c family protein
MGNFLLTDEEVQSLTGYLIANSWKGEEQFFIEDRADEQFLSELDDDAYDELTENGKVMFGRLRCLTCHPLNGRGGTKGPELVNIGKKTTGRWIGAWLRSPSLYDSRTIMPTFRLTRAERLGIAEYLRLEGEYMDEDEDEEEKSLEESAIDFSLQQRENGKKLFVSKGCFNCHALDNVPESGEFAPSLAGMADKKTDKISFGTATVAHTLPDYISAKLQAPRIFGDNLKMVFFDLPPNEVGRLTTFVLSQSSSIPPDYNQKTKPPGFVIGGEAGQLIDRYRCLSCHMIQGRGGTLAPDLTAEGSKVQKDWLIEYLQKPYAIRPTLPERMLRFNLSKQEATLLADYITVALRDRDIDAYPALTGNTDPEMGKTLYYEKYSCQSCHAIGTGGGYFGPALDQVGRRLKPNWINARLNNSHQFEKNSKEPVLAIPENDRAALVSFLSLLRGEKK